MQSRGADPTSRSSPWFPTFCREVDMTHGRSFFLHGPGPDRLPLIEGRMVQAHRLGCKAYTSGEGRSAKWRNLAPGLSEIRPQFWVKAHALSPSARHRVLKTRAGFCDITGQTNERSMMAALLPPGVACGNKVPTVEFPNDPRENRLWLWLAIVNSLPFDWLLRRVVTTTVNYFVLLSIRLPVLRIDSLPAQRLISIARQLARLDRSGRVSLDHCWRVAVLRAEADVLVANSYGCNDEDLRLMLQDFPLLDRGQPSLPGEDRSTVTPDLLLGTWARRERPACGDVLRRVKIAKELGAIAYMSSESAATVKNHLRKA